MIPGHRMSNIAIFKGKENGALCKAVRRAFSKTIIILETHRVLDVNSTSLMSTLTIFDIGFGQTIIFSGYFRLNIN